MSLTTVLGYSLQPLPVGFNLFSSCFPLRLCTCLTFSTDLTSKWIVLHIHCFCPFTNEILWMLAGHISDSFWPIFWLHFLASLSSRYIHMAVWLSVDQWFIPEVMDLTYFLYITFTFTSGWEITMSGKPWQPHVLDGRATMLAVDHWTVRWEIN